VCQRDLHLSGGRQVRAAAGLIDSEPDQRRWPAGSHGAGSTRSRALALQAEDALALATVGPRDGDIAPDVRQNAHESLGLPGYAHAGLPLVADDADCVADPEHRLPSASSRSRRYPIHRPGSQQPPRSGSRPCRWRGRTRPPLPFSHPRYCKTCRGQDRARSRRTWPPHGRHCAQIQRTVVGELGISNPVRFFRPSKISRLVDHLPPGRHTDLIVTDPNASLQRGKSRCSFESLELAAGGSWREGPVGHSRTGPTASRKARPVGPGSSRYRRTTRCPAACSCRSPVRRRSAMPSRSQVAPPRTSPRFTRSAPYCP